VGALEGRCRQITRILQGQMVFWLKVQGFGNHCWTVTREEAQENLSHQLPGLIFLGVVALSLLFPTHCRFSLEHEVPSFSTVEELPTSKLTRPLSTSYIPCSTPDPLSQNLLQCSWGICSSRKYFCLFILNVETLTLISILSSNSTSEDILKRIKVSLLQKYLYNHVNCRLLTVA
jgi:hypothetical protein